MKSSKLLALGIVICSANAHAQVLGADTTKPSPAIDRLMRQLVIPLVLLLGLYGLLRHATTGHGHRPGAEPPARVEGISAKV